MSKDKIFIYNLTRLSRSVSNAAGLVRKLKGVGTELYVLNRSTVETAEGIMKAVSGIST